MPSLRYLALQILIFWVVNAMALYLTAKITPGIRIKGFGSALVAALVLALLNTTLLQFLWMFTAPFGPIVMVLVFFILSGVMLRLTTGLVKGLAISGWFSATIGAVVMAAMQILLYYFYRRIMTTI